MAAKATLPKLPKRQIVIPANDWEPRWYQDDLWDYFENGGRHGLAVAHRRWGKDDFALNLACTKAHQRIGNYWHLLPEAEQARKALWNAVDETTGVRRIDQAFPLAIRETTRENEMLIKLKCGSTWQVGGSDNYNSLVGASPIGITLSEYGLANPSARSFLRPILANNGGWELLISTPRGRNHLAKLYDKAITDPAWFAVKQTAYDTDVFSEETLAAELADLIAERGKDDGRAIFEQEYLCSFDAAVVGAIYRQEFIDAEREGRLSSGLYDPALTVWTAWDLGFADAMVIWFFQISGGQIRIIDYYINNGKPLSHYCKLVREKPYVYEKHIFPHDIEAGEQIAGKKRVDVARSLLGSTPFHIVPRSDPWEGINAVKRIFPRLWFDTTSQMNGPDGPCVADGIAALRQYQRRWNDKLKRFENQPLHDWCSDPADGLRYLALGVPLTLSSSRISDRRRGDRQSGRIVRRSTGRRPYAGMTG